MENGKRNVLLSIIIPVYKVEAFIDQCVSSILCQNSSELEIILVDDGSPDKCPEICDKYALQHKNVTVIHKKNGGLISARKAGVKVARGKYITFVDSDDWIAADYCSNLIRIIKEYSPEIIAVTGHYKVESDGQTIHCRDGEQKGLYERDKLEKEIFPTLLYNPPYYNFGVAPSLCLKVIEKEMLKKCIQDVPEGISMGEDLSVSFPALFSAQAVFFMEQSGYYYRMNPTSITHKYDKNSVIKIETLLNYIEKKLGQDTIYNIGTQLDMYAVWIAYLTIISLALGSEDIHRDLDRAGDLLRNKHVIKGLTQKIPLKTKIILKLAINKKTNLLLLTRKCFILKESIKKKIKP